MPEVLSTLACAISVCVLPLSRPNTPTLSLIDVLNRFPAKKTVAVGAGQHDESVLHIMMYLFPRQFGLHNVFTSTVDRRQTVQKFQDYTLREEEIASKIPTPADGAKPAKHVPKRLRGAAMDLVRRLQVLHSRCSYAEMLHHYCPVSTLAGFRSNLLTSLGTRTTWRPKKSAGGFN